MFENKLTRRGFVEGAAALGATGMVAAAGGVVLADEAPASSNVDPIPPVEPRQSGTTRPTSW